MSPGTVNHVVTAGGDKNHGTKEGFKLDWGQRKIASPQPTCFQPNGESEKRKRSSVKTKGDFHGFKTA